MNLKPTAFAIILALYATAGIAETAPWYKWRSKIEDAVICSQTSPGEGWEIVSGPYKTVRCDVLGLPGH